MQPTKHHVILEGALSVAYHQEDGLWFATALEFDIMGFGENQEQALAMLRELFSEYLIEVAHILVEGKKVSFFNPSDSEKWDLGYERYNVCFNYFGDATPITPAPSMGKLKEFIDSLGGVGVESIEDIEFVGTEC